MVTRLSEDVWWVNLTGVNAFVLDDDGALTLVDAGLPWDARRLRRAITSVGKSLSDVERVFVTHYDVDHVGSLDKLDDLDATVYIGRDDEPYLTGRASPSLSTQKGVFQRAVDWTYGTPSLPVEPVDDGDEIGSFTAYSAPGHTPGHTIYVSEALDVALLGDLVWERGGRFEVVPWFICHDHEQAKADVKSIVSRVPPFEVACQGHGVPFVENGYTRLRECVNSLA